MLGDHGNEDFILIKLPRCHKYMCTFGKDGAQCYASLHCDEHGHLRTLAIKVIRYIGSSHVVELLSHFKK